MSLKRSWGMGGLEHAKKVAARSRHKLGVLAADQPRVS